LMVFPWKSGEQKTAGVICDIYDSDGKTLFEDVPRFVLKKCLSKMKEHLGREADFFVSPELEFWLFRMVDGKLRLHDEGRYFSPPPFDRGYEVREEMALTLGKMGVKTVKSHHETSPGKHELNITHGTALKIADTMVMYKFVTKLLASQRDLIASFMPKPFLEQAGMGMHIHQNISNGKTGENLFYDSGSPDGLSETAHFYIGGLLKHARALVAITNPTVNSYKRFHQARGLEAPSFVSWARYNRTVMVRIPPATPRAARVEYRASDASCNPYLTFAAMLMAGLDGMRRKVTPPDPVEENIYTLTREERGERGIADLPRNLNEALDELEKDGVMKDALGEVMHSKFTELKRAEWREYNTNVYDWERDKYLDV